MAASLFSVVQPGPPIEVFALNKECVDDTFEEKVNLIIGAYRTEESQPWVLPVVRKTEIMLANNEKTNHEYLPILGSGPFSTAATAMLLGKDSKALKEKRAFGVQTLSGTGALSVGSRFLVQHLGAKHFYYSEPTWENHRLVFQHAGFEKGFTYRYWHAGKRGIDMEGLLEDLSKAEPNSVIILHSCAHNPTGCDPTLEQWVQIAAVMKEKKLFPFFDSAYQGFASGDLDEDAKAVRYFIDQGFELLCAQSFAKNFGLYSQRVGNLTFVTNDPSTIPSVLSQVTIIVRGLYSNPPSHGSSIVSTVLNDPELFQEWQGCIKTMSDRIKKMRAGLKERLVKLQTPGSWEHITSQIGMFSYTGLTPAQVQYLKTKHHVYALKSGRINMAAVTTKNLDYVASSIHDAVVNVNE